jgi:hypothetical protein
MEHRCDALILTCINDVDPDTGRMQHSNHGARQETSVSSELDQLRRTVPDLAHLDPLSTEVREWLDRACNAVRRVDEAEGVVFAMHQRYLLDPAEKIVASAEIVAAVERAIGTRAILQRTGMERRTAA